MPTYEYECAKCRKEFEIFQSMKDDALTVCPKNKCRQKKWGRGRVKRKLGAGAGFIFKGSGFYITDYRSEAYKTKARGDKPASDGGSATATKTDSGKSDSSKSDSGKSESKPASKPATKTGE